MTDKFLDKYRELEVATRYAYKLGKYDSAVAFLKKQKIFEKYKADIDLISDIRNLLSHNRKISGEYAVQPSVRLIEFMDNLISEIAGRKQCKDIAIKSENILKKNMRGKVFDTIEIMNRRNFTHVPIVENRRVVGVFSRNSFFTYVAEHITCPINRNLTFAEIKEYLSLDKREKEDYIFVKSTLYADELDEIFDTVNKSGRRVGLVFLTHHGTKDEPIQGMLTPWDVLNA